MKFIKVTKRVDVKKAQGGQPIEVLVNRDAITGILEDKKIITLILNTGERINIKEDMNYLNNYILR